MLSSGYFLSQKKNLEVQKVFIWRSTGKSLYYKSTQSFSTNCKHHYEIISQGNEKFVAYTLCLKCHVQNKLQDWGGCMWELACLFVSLSC